MANKSVPQSYNGMVQDIAQSKFSNNFYFEGKNIRILATDTQSTGSVTNEKGNSLILTIPIPNIDYDNKIISYNDKTLSYTNDEIDYINQSGDQIVIGHSENRNYIILFTTDNNGFDCIWKIDYETYNITLLYLRNLSFSINNPIQTINNFENEDIDKVYWVDGVNQMRFINIEHSIANDDLEELIDVPQNVISMVGKYELSQPIIVDVLSGGSHTAGMIQYAYNLYRLNSSQTKISPLSELIPLDKNTLGGGALNELVGALPVVSISNIDNTFTNIRVYSIKYTSYNELPVISLIDDREIPSNGNIEIFDDSSAIQTISVEEFIFLGSDILIPKHINSKFNRLFFANYKEINFNVDIDSRAYAYNSSGSATIYDNLFLNAGVPDGTPFTITTDSDYDNPILNKFDSVNLNYDLFKYQKDGTTIGGEGKYITYQLTQSLVFNPDNKYFKDEEIYRIGIEFYNNFGQFSTPNWIADFKSLNGNLEGKYNTLKVTLKPAFFTWLNTYPFISEYDKPIGYKIVIAERTLNDKTIVANGLINPMMINDKSTRDVPSSYTSPDDINYVRNKGKTLPKLPNFLVRNCNQNTLYGNVRPLYKALNLKDMCINRTQDTEIQRAYIGDTDTSGRFYQFNTMLQLYSPEILFGESVTLSESLTLRIKGSLSNHDNDSWARSFKASSGELQDESKAIGGLSTFYSPGYNPILNNGYLPYNRGLIGHPADSSPDKVVHMMYYRNYGVPSTDIVTPINTVALLNDLTLVTGTDPDNLIILDSANKRIQMTLDVDHQLGELEYTITPNVGFTTVIYTIKLTSDFEGNNIITSLDNVIGTQIINYLPTLSYPTPTTRTDQIYLVIESTSLIEGNIDVNVNIGVDPSPEYIEYESLTNPFSIDTSLPAVVPLFTPSTGIIKYNIYGKPELTEKGQSGTTYNNDSNYRYLNSLQSMYTDGDSHYDDNGKFGRRIVSVNSYGNRCITLVTGPDNPAIEHWNRPSIESIFLDNGLTGDNNGLIGELVKSDVEIYLGNIYGGNSYEDKKRSNYIEIGEYKELNPSLPSINILSPGDTFINSFKFARIVRTDVDIMQEGIYVLEELVEVLSESTVDLKNRNDLSLNEWDSKFQPSDSEYHKYNRVYSQLPNLIQRRDLNYNTKRLNNFDTNIIASKLKSAGELIDNWTDLQTNEVMTLDGKHGPINSFPSFNDELYTLQDKAVAYLSISPRVQVQGGDGLEIQLGTGSVLDKYKYITTDSGTLNKWSVIPTSQGIYYFDVLNKAFMVYKGQVGGLSDAKGIHTYFNNNISLEELKIDNPLIKQGISSGFDYINNDVFMTFHQSDNNYTISYNESKEQFTSFYDYIPSIYISKGKYFITTNPNLNKIYRQYDGNYNIFYDVYYPSHIILNINPEPDKDCVFDNINFKSEVYINNVDQVDNTLTHIQAYNDYQNSGLIPLVVGRNNNLRRKFRDWNALVPREGRNRIRAPWIKMKLIFNNNTNNYKFILHDLNIFYTV